MPGGIQKYLIKLWREFKNSRYVTPVDFVETLVAEGTLCEDKVHNFIDFIRHEKFFKELANTFVESIKLWNVKIEVIMVQIYFIIFLLNIDNLEDMEENIHSYTKDILDFLSSEATQKSMAITASKYFENDYILNRIIDPLRSKIAVIAEVKKNIDLLASKNLVKPSPTIPDEVEMLSREFDCFKASPGPPHNSLTTITSKAFEPPKTTYDPEKYIQDHLAIEYQKNRLKAEKLLQEAAKIPDNLIQVRKAPEAPPQHQVVMKARKAPPRKAVEIKGNLATTFRTASRILKQQEEDIKRIEDIIKGGCNLQRIEELEEEHRKQESQQQVDDIERKHLQGLLTYEEAILAKKRVAEENQMKALEVKQIKIDLIEKVERWREEEQAKIKEQVERSQKIRNDAKESEKKILEEKQMQVKMQKFETKLQLQKAYQERAKELAKKAELIHEIRTMHEITIQLNERQREFDPTETANLGLLCEMSIAELQERLVIAKMKMASELETKRNRIAKTKSEQQKMIENVKNFIAQTHRMSKPKAVSIRASNLERPSPDLLELRRLLEEKRSLRTKTT